MRERVRSAAAAARAWVAGARAWAAGGLGRRGRPDGRRAAAGGGSGKLGLVVVLVLVVWSAAPRLWFGRDGPGVPAVDLGLAALGAAQAVPLLWRRRAPDAVLVACGVAVGGGLLAHPRILPASIALLIAAYSMPVHARRREWPWSGWLAWVVGVVALLLFSGYVYRPRLAAPDSLFLLYLAGAWAVGRVRRQYLDLAVREHEQHTRQALAAERTRIARELHDLLAHSMSSMVVLAGVAQRVAASRPDRARELLAAIETTGRDGLAETQRLLGVLRSSAGVDQEAARDEGGTLTPAPRLERVGELVDNARRAGLEVRVEGEGVPGRLPAGVELSAYRIIQEALTNVLRHAGAARAWLTLRYSDGVLEVEVLDDGAQEPRHRSSGQRPSGDGGYGLVGMRERAATLGGTLEAGPRPGGGWRVLARLPSGTGGEP